MDLVNLVITPVVESLMVPIKKHLGFLVSSTKYVKDMKEKMEQLKLSEQDIQKNFDEAVEKDYRVSHHVSPWLEKVRKTGEEAQSVPTGGIRCFNVATRYKAGKQSYNILKDIQALETWKSDIVFTQKQRPLAKVASTNTGPSTSTPVGTQNNFESRELIYKAALESLQSNDESHKMIALCGMGGVGKTTMMEQLKKQVEASKLFDWVVKVVIGENTDLIALQRAIAINISSEDLKEETKDARADRLRTIFEGWSTQGKKTLVIMDDLWSVVDLKDVGLSPLPNGFKMMLTSRDERFCTQMGVRSNSIFTVGLLNDAEAKTLFFEAVGLSDGDDPSLEKIGEAIVNECRGLPIAIVTIAKSLCNRIKEAWEKALWRLKKDDLQDLESITQRIFEMSYENLKKDEKEIFLLSGLFPDDFNIPTEDLVRYGWGLGFFKDAETLATARRDMKICVSNLIHANLLSESDRMGCVKMHDLLRAFVLSNFSEVKQASVVNYEDKPNQRSTKDASLAYHRILLNCKGMIEFPPRFINPNLSMLMLMGGDDVFKFPEDIYERMENLEVVAYEDMHIPLLPIRFEHSTKLRTLCLRSCKFISDDVSFLGSLSNLETLSFPNCGITWLPSTIGKLIRLKLLDLTGCVQLRIDDGVFKKLVSLEELYMRAGNDSRIQLTDNNCDELEILSHRLFALELEFFENKAQPKKVHFKNLERFRISIGCQLKDEEEYSFRNTIHFLGDYNELLECEISALFEKTEELFLKVNGLMNHLEDHSFSNLTVLHVSECANLTYLCTVKVASGLKKLERLTVSNCPVLRMLVAEDSRVEVIRFQKLKFMSLTGLPKMVSLWDNVIELPEVAELIVGDLPNFTSTYPSSHNTNEIQSLLNKKVKIPKLEKLYISRMENLKHIWSCEVTTKINNLFPSSPLTLINHLNELKVEECDSIEVLFNINFEGVSGIGEPSCRLRSIEVNKLKKLKELWRIEGVNNSGITINCFKSVERIQIKSCSIFENIFTPTTTEFDLGALTEYTTEDTSVEIPKGEITELDDDIPKVTYLSDLLHTCHDLQRLKLKNDKRVGEVVFDMDGPSSSQLATTQPPLLLPYLQSIQLSRLEEMRHVWKCNWNRFLIRHHPPLQFPFQNLTKISLRRCDKIKYLFSPFMAKYLSNLKNISLQRCGGIEEVISSRDDENTTSTSSYDQGITLFPCLDTVNLEALPCLKSVDDGQIQSPQGIGAAYWSLCQYPRNLFIDECPAMSSLIPWYAVGQMNRLQELYINDCSRMAEVFESESSTNNAQGTSLTSPTLKTIPQLSNLKTMSISDCDLLSHVFTISTLESLKQLKELEVIRCKAIQVIVQEEEEDTGKSSEAVVFPHLHTLLLDELPKLKGFFLGKNEFRWPSLDNVKIDGCPELMMFTSGKSETPKLKYIETSLERRHSLESCGINFNRTISEEQTAFPSSSAAPTISNGLPCSFHNLIGINIFLREEVGPAVIPFHALPQLQKLQQITIDFCRRVEEVFEVVALEGSGFNESVKIPNLTQVTLVWLDGLKYLWKSNQWMVLEFPNLTTVSIIGCGSLEHVFTCSMAGSLVQLQYLSIRWCNNIEVIVKEEEEGDAKVNEIMLPRLNSLKLKELHKLKGFCLGKEAFSLPALDTLQINKCPSITCFLEGQVASPELKVIDTTFGRWYAKPDINSFIKTKQGEGYEF